MYRILRSLVRKLAAPAGLGAALVLSATPAQAGGVNWSLGVHSGFDPAVSLHVGNGRYHHRPYHRPYHRPHYYRPQPVYVAPQPVYVAPPVYTTPVYVAPQPVVVVPAPAPRYPYGYRPYGYRHWRSRGFLP